MKLADLYALISDSLDHRDAITSEDVDVVILETALTDTVALVDAQIVDGKLVLVAG